jgi:hypothetical protein
MASRFTSLLDVALAVGGSVTLPHGLLDQDVPIRPNLVQPSSGTGLVVLATTTTTVTFGNPTAGALTARFMCALLYSTQSTDGDVPAGSFVWSGVDPAPPPAAGGWADAITSWSTPVPGTVWATPPFNAPPFPPPPINYFDRSVTIPADTLEVGDVLEILVGGEYTTIIAPGFDSANVAVSLGTLGFINGNSGPIDFSGSQFVLKARATIASTGVLGTLLLFQENDFELQATGILQYSPQQTGPHNIDTTVPNTIQVRGEWGITTDPGASMVLKTLTANIIKKAG